MNGSALLEEIRKRLHATGSYTRVTDAAIAQYLGIKQPSLVNYRDREITPRQIARLLERAKRSGERDIIRQTIVPIMEFMKIDTGVTESKRNRIFLTDDSNGTPHPYFSGLKDRLDTSHGIYIFHDSRGRAIYAGKAQRLSLWKELNNAVHRDRGEIQNIKRVSHPTNRIAYRGTEEKTRRIVKENVALSHIAAYVSAYQVPDSLISKLEALIVRSFANELLNVRMENF